MNYERASQVTNSINERIYDRNLPSSLLQPYLSVRPVMTKYSIMPIVDPRKKLFIPMEQMPTYSPHKTFNPGNTQSPWSGFASSINQESELRNQIFALQNCPQSVYVPNSTSDLYVERIPTKTNLQQPFPGLFKDEAFSPFNPNHFSNAVGDELFNNNTRVQVRGLTNLTNACEK
jgi:hypothetical protein